MVHRPVWFWKDVYPLVLAFCRREHVAFNSVVNQALQSFLGAANVEELRLRAQVSCLLREENHLRKVCSCMLRSGAYLSSYAEKVLKSQKGKVSESPFCYGKDDGKPLRALSKSEELIFRKICARREEIALEVARVQNELMRGTVPFRFEFEEKNSESCRYDKKKILSGGEK